jgi:hypothetical protein
MPRKQPKLILAAYRGAEARRIVAHQRGLIAMLQAKGESIVNAEGMLDVYLSRSNCLRIRSGKSGKNGKQKKSETKKTK